MRLKTQHAPYIANKISLDLSNADFIEIAGSLDNVTQVALQALQENIQQEREINERANELLQEHETEIEDYRMDENELAWKFRRQIASERNFSLSWDERCSDISHKILTELTKARLIGFKVSEMIVKNTIHKAINEYSRIYEKSEEEVLKKIDKYKRRLVAGSEEYNIIFAKLYEEELRKRGLA